MDEQHLVTITPRPHVGSVPFVFEASCDCGRWTYASNAYKWTALAVQGHYVEAGLTNGRGIFHEEA